MNDLSEKARTISPSNPFYGKIPMEKVPGTDLDPMQTTSFAYDRELGTPFLQVTTIICKSDFYDDRSCVKVNVYFEKNSGTEKDNYICNLSRDLKNPDDSIELFNDLSDLVEKTINGNGDLRSEDLASLLISRVAEYIDPVDMTLVK